ncbi:DUF2064 domain-containing protein [Paroceanicella profunda]|nr:DUF2064 domain-containing protein [Paroceanicella profunda]
MARARRQTVMLLDTPAAGPPGFSTGAAPGPRLPGGLARLRDGALLRRLGNDPRWTVLAASPALRRTPCSPAGQGAALARLLRDIRPGPVLVVDPRIPGIDRRHIAEAFAALGRSDAVLGPTPGGGYWLIGLARARCPAPPALFRDVRWLSRHTLGDTLAGLQGHRVTFVSPLEEPARPCAVPEARAPRQPALRLVVT